MRTLATNFCAVLKKFPSAPDKRWVCDMEFAPHAPSWFWSLIHPPDPNRTSNLDIYFFLRYLRTLLKIFGPIALVIPPILIPLDFLQGRGADNGINGLDRLSWANVGLSHTDRYWVHLILGVGIVAYVCFIIWTELQKYIKVRQDNRHILSTTVLIDSIPDEWLHPRKLEQQFSLFPGGVRNINLNRNFATLSESVRRRDDIAAALEEAEIRLIRKVLQAYSKGKRKGHYDKTCEATWEAYLDKSERELVTLPEGLFAWMLTPFLRPKVDAIDYYREEYRRLSFEIESAKKAPERFPALNSAFIQFNTQIAAQMVCQTVLHESTDHMRLRNLQISPKDILWDNISIGWWENFFRIVISNTAIVALTILCVVPVTFAGLLSQIVYLTRAISWLSWVDKLPDWLLGLIQGVLPPTMLSAFVALFSFSLRYLVRKQGIHSKAAVELLIQDYYFSFLFLQITLIVSLSAGLTTIFDEVRGDAASLPATLAKSFPKASNYFLSYVLLQSLSVSAGALLQIGTLVDQLILSPLLDRTVTQKLARTTDVVPIQWGVFVPVYTNLSCIGRFQFHLSRNQQLTY